MTAESLARALDISEPRINAKAPNKMHNALADTRMDICFMADISDLFFLQIEMNLSAQ